MRPPKRGFEYNGILGVSVLDFLVGGTTYSVRDCLVVLMIEEEL